MDAPDQNAIYNSALSQVQAQNAPVISGLQNQQSGLKDQYQSLIGQLNSQQGLATQQTSTQTSRDFGARGIPLSSGLFNQTLGEREQPIVQDYTNRIAGANADQTNSLNQIATQIAQAQSGVTDQARQLAQQQYGNAQGAYQAQLDEAYRQSQAQIQQQQFAAQQAASQQAARAASGGAVVNTNQPNPQNAAQPAANAYVPRANDIQTALQLRNGISSDNQIDRNEAGKLAVALSQRGYSQDQANAILDQLFSSGTLKKYGTY